MAVGAAMSHSAQPVVSVLSHAIYFIATKGFLYGPGATYILKLRS